MCVLKNSLFKNCDLSSIEKILDSEKIILKTYEKDSIIVQEYEECKSIGFIIKGSLYVNEILENGDTLRIKLYKENDSFGAVHYLVQTIKIIHSL